MRNLKRALSLTLASVMLLGMMVLGTSAASYPDVTDEHNVEAIEVLQAIGVMSGSNSGNFNPDSKVSRIEMAIVMANLLDLNVDYFQGQNTFSDVPDWASGYVNACAASGIVTGVGGGRFGTGNVTATQAALMMLKALGYFQYNSDFGSDWARATALQANKINLFDGIDVQDNTQLTRNHVAQLALNALESTIVDAEDNTLSISGGAGETAINVSGGSVKYIVRTSSKSFASAISAAEYTGSSTSGITGRTVELGEQLYNGDLKKSENVTDDLGRPSVRWTYKVNEIGTYNNNLLLSSTKKVSTGDLYALIGSTNVNALSAPRSAALGLVYDSGTSSWVPGPTGSNNLIVYQDGEIISGNAKGFYFDRNSSSGALSGNGVLTQVFQDDDNNVTITYTNTYVAQATADYSSNKGSVSVVLLTKPTDRAATATDPVFPSTEWSAFNELTAEDFEAVEDIKENDYILYTYAKKGVQTIALAEVVKGEVSAFTQKTGKSFGDAGGSVTIGENKYNYAKFADVSTTNGCAVEYTVGVEAAVVCDADGYAYYVDDSALSVGNYVYINAIATETNLSTNIIADAYFTDGANDTITVKSIKNGNTDLATGFVNNRKDINKWFSYSRNSKGEYTLKQAATNGWDASTTISQNSTRVGGATANNKTLFIVKDKNKNVTVYTGIAEVPDITGITTSNTQYMLEKDTASKPISVVFVDATGGTVKNSKSNFIYLLGENSRTVDNTDHETVVFWDVIMENKQDVIKTKDTSWTKGTLFESYSIDKDGYYEATLGTANDEFAVAGYPGDNTSDKTHAVLTTGAGSKITDGTDTITIKDTARTVSFVVDSNTKIHLVMAPITKGAGATLAGSIMTNDNADFEVATGIKNTELSAKFKGYWVSGEYFVKYKDADKHDLISDLYVVITDAARDTSVPASLASPSGSQIQNALNDGMPVEVTGNTTIGTAVTVAPTRELTLKGDTTLNSTMTVKGTVTAEKNVTGTGKVVLDGGKLVLDGTTDTVPVVEGSGTVEIKTDVKTSNDSLTGTAEKLGGKKANVVANEGKTVPIDKATIGLTGDANLTNFNGSKTIDEYVDSFPGASSVELYEIKLTDLQATYRIKGYRSVNGTTWTGMNGVLDPTNSGGYQATEETNTQETFTLLEGDNIRFIKFVISKDGSTWDLGENCYEVIFEIR